MYASQIDGKNLTFGVSGRLYKSNVLIYDHQSESLWSQLKETAIAGPMVGSKLRKIPASRTTWQRWRKLHPHTRVLSTDTGYARDYDIDPYEGYYRALGIMFPVGDVRTDLPAKEMVLGVEIDGAAKAYPLARLKGRRGVFGDRIGPHPIQIYFSLEGQVETVKNRSGDSLPYLFAYWFAWQAFHPQTTVYGGEK